MPVIPNVKREINPQAAQLRLVGTAVSSLRIYGRQQIRNQPPTSRGLMSPAAGSRFPIPIGEKGCKDNDWKNIIYDANRHFDGLKNIGVQLGPVSGGLTDVDLDTPGGD